MSDIKDLLDAEAQKIRPPAVAVGRTQVEELAQKRERRRRITATGVGLAIAVPALVFGWAALRPSSNTTATPVDTPSPNPSLPANTTVFVPPTYDENGQTVMPITFPDGTSVELVYPPSLPLGERGVHPNTYGVVGAGEACGGNLLFRAWDAKGEIFGGAEPIATFPTKAGGRAELWSGIGGWPGDFLVFQFGHWQVLVNCVGDEDASMDQAEQWASLLEGSETPDGLLVLTGQAPLRLAEIQDQHGPELFLESGGDDGLITMTPATGCATTEVDRGPSLVRWCIHGKTSAIVVSAHYGDTKFVESVVDGLQVRDSPSP